MRNAPLLLLLACTTAELEPEPVNEVTWTDVAPVIAATCTSCHSASGTASFRPFQRYEDTAPYSALIAEQVAKLAMPPFGPQQTDWCDTDFQWEGDIRLTDEEIDLLVRWANGGAPIGQGASEPLEVPAAQASLPGANMTLPIFGWTTNPEIEDQTICFLLDPQLDAPGWLEGVNVVPGDLSVVHHAGIRLDYSGDADTLANDDGWFDCSNGTGVPMEYLGTYAPGSGPSIVPDGTATAIPVGAKIVLSVHYHSTGTEPVYDQTALELRWADAEPPRIATLLHWPNPPDIVLADILQPGPNDNAPGPKIFIPAGASDHTETLAVQAPGTPDQQYEIYQIASHMHLVGRSSRIWAEHPDGTIQCLADMPNWNFYNQQMYRYQHDALPTVPGGSTFWMECSYDNTLGNGQLATSLADRGLAGPQDVRFGAGSFDEMCMFMIGLIEVQAP